MTDLISAIKRIRELCKSDAYGMERWSDAVMQLGEASHAASDDLHGDTLALIQKLGTSAKWVVTARSKPYEVRVTARETLAIECKAALDLLEGKA